MTNEEILETLNDALEIAVRQLRAENGRLKAAMLAARDAESPGDMFDILDKALINEL